MNKDLLKMQDISHENSELKKYIEKLEDNNWYLIDLKNFYKQQYEFYYDMHFNLLEEKEKGENK